MHDRKNRDYSTGPVWNPDTSRWLVEIRYPNGSRTRKRFRRERDAIRVWAAEQTKIESGAWDERAPRNLTLGIALEQYRDYAKVQHRAYETYDVPALALWERELGAATLLARIGPAQIETVKLTRAQRVSRPTVDKDLAVLKAFFNWAIGRSLAANNPVRRVKLFHEDNARLRYLSQDEYDRLLAAPRTLSARTSVSTPSPYLIEKIILAAHTGLRRGSLFNLRWDHIDLEHRVLRIPRTKSGRPLSVPLNVTAHDTLTALHEARDPISPYVFPHRVGPNAGAPVMDIKNGFHAALELAKIDDFTWHDLRHTFASWLMMRGASLRSVAELLGHTSMKMTMRYAHLSPAFLSAEVSLLDPPKPPPADEPPSSAKTASPVAPTSAVEQASLEAEKGKKAERARKGQSDSSDTESRSEVPEFVKDFGSSGWTRTSNPPVNSLTLVGYLVGSSVL
jgi:integrase